jgi:hypothetical protein
MKTYGFKSQFGPALENDTLPFGQIVCVCDLVDAVPISHGKPEKLSEAELALGNYTDGRFAWLLDNIQRLTEPFPVTGRQGFFWTNIPDRLLCSKS